MSKSLFGDELFKTTPIIHKSGVKRLHLKCIKYYPLALNVQWTHENDPHNL